MSRPLTYDTSLRQTDLEILVMLHLSDIQPNQLVQGILPNAPVRIISVQSHGSDALTVFFERPDGTPDRRLLYRADEPTLSLVSRRITWDVTADAAGFRLAVEAQRIRLAYLFDPRIAIHISHIEPLPHQISAVYEQMLPRLPLRFLLADDPGAGKTIMAGLLVKELMMRGDVKRCLICAPGSLVEQWQMELAQKFSLQFTILTREMVETAPTGNAFNENHLVIVRLDQFSRSETFQKQLEDSDEWDLAIVDEAHKLSAQFVGGEIKRTKRYQVGEKLAQPDLVRQLLLMTATPHNGNEATFQLLLRLLDEERFHLDSRFTGDVPPVDASDLMRRMVKEDLKTFDGRPLFPERHAHTLAYQLSEAEMDLYQRITQYVTSEFDRADKLTNQKKNTVGFALTSLQRRLASSPAAIHKSLNNRIKRLEKRLRDAQHDAAALNGESDIDDLGDFMDAFDEAPDDERESLERRIADAATAATTIPELDIEINTLKRLERNAANVLNSRTDRKWEELADLLQNKAELFEGERRRKIIIFTEFRDTLEYLRQRISTLLGDPQAVTSIYGSMPRDKRLEVQNEFTHNPNVLILIATDAAGEGINLHRASHLMVNYDLPWNPNRIEQRFGRIHRIGQTEICHLWNLVADQTREGNVYLRLLTKLAVARESLGGRVFDVLGQLFIETPLRDLLLEAVRYGDSPAAREKLMQRVENAAEQERIRQVLEQRALTQDRLDTFQVTALRDEMQRAEARRLQPYFIRNFFLSAFQQLGGKFLDPKNGSYRLNHVPKLIRDKAPRYMPIASEYARVCFEKHLVDIPGKPSADLLSPGHALLDVVVDLTLEQRQSALDAGVVLVDPADPHTQPRTLFILESHISAADRVVASELHFIEISAEGIPHRVGYAPHLDYRLLHEAEQAQVQAWLAEHSMETSLSAEAIVQDYAVQHLVPRHLDLTRAKREERISKVQAAVHERLGKAITYWDRRAHELREKERRGKLNARLNAQQADEKARDLQERLQQRTAELSAARALNPLPPRVVGRALIIPIGMLLSAESSDALRQNRLTESLAMRAVMEHELRLGNEPRDVSSAKCGYDIESRDRQTGMLRLIEVKGRHADAQTVVLTHNEILTALNQPEHYHLAFVEVADGAARKLYYLSKPPFSDPGKYAESVTFDWMRLIVQADLVWQA